MPCVDAPRFLLTLNCVSKCWPPYNLLLEQGTFLVGQPSPQSSGKQLTPASVVQGSVGVGAPSTQGQALKVITGQKTALFTQVMSKWRVFLLPVSILSGIGTTATRFESFSFWSCLGFVQLQCWLYSDKQNTGGLLSYADIGPQFSSLISVLGVGRV